MRPRDPNGRRGQAGRGPRRIARPSGGAPPRARSGWELLLERLGYGWVEIDRGGRRIRLSDSLRATGAAASGLLPRGVLRRLHRETATLRPGESRAFSLASARAPGRPRFRVVAAGAGDSGVRGGGRVVCALRLLPSRAAPARGLASLGSSRVWSGREAVSWEGLLAAARADLLSPRRNLACKVELDAHVDAGLPRVLGDRELLGRMLREAALAGLASMPDGGTLSFRVRRAEAPDGAAVVRLLVRDTGQGLGAASIARIQAGGEHGREIERRLCVVRAIAESHGGRMHLVSAPGCGTSVVLELPVEPARGPSTHRTRAEAA